MSSVLYSYNSLENVYFFKYSRLSIASAQAFLLVYSVSDPLSFVTIKHRFEEIKEQRSDFQVNFEINLHIKYHAQSALQTPLR